MAVDVIDPGPVSYVPVYASAARTASPNAQRFNLNERGDIDGLLLVIDITNVTATGSVTFEIDGYDPVSNQTWAILTSAAQTAATGAGTPLVLRVQNNIPAVANKTAQDIVPPFVQIKATHLNGVSVTYSAALFFDF